MRLRELFDLDFVDIAALSVFAIIAAFLLVRIFSEIHSLDAAREAREQVRKIDSEVWNPAKFPEFPKFPKSGD